MLKTEYQFVIEMLTTEGASLGQYPVTIDWEPAREQVRLLVLRRGKTDPAIGGEAIAIEPIFDQEKLGEPYADGVRLTYGDIVCEIERAYFKPVAVEVSGTLVEKQLLKAGELFLFQLIAHRRTSQPEDDSAVPFTVRNITPALRFVDTPLHTFEGTAVDDEHAGIDDFPVFIPQRVLDDLEQLTSDAGSCETGGILIGHLHRDATIAEIAVVITALIPAHHTTAKTTSLTFTAETWTAVQAALDLRKSGEMWLGWAHSHPSFAFCKPECPAERRRECTLQKPFLSNDDVVLHRTVFSKGYHIALLANHADAGIGFALYGWRRGIVQRRGFQILGATRPARVPEFSTEPSTGDHAHASPCEK